MRRLVLLAAVTLVVAGCGLREGTEPADEPRAFATVTSVARPSLELIGWMDTICGLADWLADTSEAGRALRDAAAADDYLLTVVVYVDTRLAQLSSLPETHTDGDALATDLTTALQAARPRIVTLTTGARTAPLPEKLNRAAGVAALLDEVKIAGPSIMELIAEDPELSTAHAMTRGCA